MASYGDFAYFYDNLTDNVDYEKRCSYIKGLLAENGVGEGILLDLACGTGTVSLMLSDMGYDVIGVDASEDMLSVAQEKKMESGADVTIVYNRQAIPESFKNPDFEGKDMYFTMDLDGTRVTKINMNSVL